MRNHSYLLLKVMLKGRYHNANASKLKQNISNELYCCEYQELIQEFITTWLTWNIWDAVGFLISIHITLKDTSNRIFNSNRKVSPLSHFEAKHPQTQVPSHPHFRP